ncbi:hypothetical protein COLO4_24380 [Corchorus olitorius]|uniref:Uncharacterized protein n=1 Tax=Corchorus olitorius TaxID=93759 RepID=A0A1R3IAL5_9ROSI|nr:hypothetical protein COLO4_24380 [Corchorus olitorius]
MRGKRESFLDESLCVRAPIQEVQNSGQDVELAEEL